MNVVVDSNVIISGLLSPFSPCGEIVRMISSGNLKLCFDARIISEYADVLHRPRFNFNLEHVAAFLDQLSHSGNIVSSVPIDVSLPDPDDSMFLEVAIAGQVECLVTGNIKHFPVRMRQGVSVLVPKDFIELFKISQRKSRLK